MAAWNKFFILFFVVVLGFILYWLAPILTPFLIGGLLAYLANPLVKQLMRLKLPRLLSVIIVFLILFAVMTLFVLLLIPLIQDQVLTLTVVIPNAIAWLQKTVLPWVQQYIGNQELINVNGLKQSLAENWMKAGGVLTWAFKTALHSGKEILVCLANLIIVPVVTFYLLRDWDSLVKGAHDLLPRTIAPTVARLVKEGNEVLSAFFRGQLLVMLSLSIIYSIGLTVIGLQIGLLIGLLAGILSIVPYLGLIVGLLSGGIAAYLQFGTLSSVLLVLLVFVIGQTLESTLLTPNLVGNRIGLHPVAVIFAVLTGGALFGFFGVLLALPTAAVIMVWIRFLNQQYRKSSFYR